MTGVQTCALPIYARCRASSSVICGSGTNGRFSSSVNACPGASPITRASCSLVFSYSFRAAVARWLPLVDRLSPIELLRTVLADSAYALEMRGPGFRQSRENLKRLRAMIRRFQNRGYATLGRVADHLDELAAGDEANATIDASDSVSLMAVHASKGLEFPIVFLVNIGRGTGNVRPPIRVAQDRAGEAHVAVADYQSEADAETQAREREETTRLLYVAVTRARDRLYFSTSVVAGQARMGVGGLGWVLPQSLRHTIASAVPVDRDVQVTWSGRGGAHHFLVPADSLPTDRPTGPAPVI